MITVGLDFGTHQTKICVERKEGVELSYTFMKFENADQQLCYTLPSVIGIGKDDLLSYGYLPHYYDGKIIRYFKQNTFMPISGSMSQESAMRYSVWYIAYLLFLLEERCGQQFAIQIGSPTDSSHVDVVKKIATRVVVSAYRLVEEIFDNDKQKFLRTPLSQLIKLTEIVDYSHKIKDEYGLLVFPEAYACLKPLVNQGKLTNGMSLMIDIGGGTTDISFFTIENKKPQVYDFYSVNKGLNFLTDAYSKEQPGTIVNVADSSEIIHRRRSEFVDEISQICRKLNSKLEDEFRRQTRLGINRLRDALQNRPLVYSGGGSTFNNLCVEYEGYEDKKLISHEEWNLKAVKDIGEIIHMKLCPILSTAYGLSISTENDNILKKPFVDIFDTLRGVGEEHHKVTNKRFNKHTESWNLYEDWDALK